MKIKYLLVPAFVFGFFFVSTSHHKPWHQLYCGALLPLVTWSPESSGLVDCSNVIQVFMSSYNNIMSDVSDEQPGFSILKPIDSSYFGSFRIRVKYDRPWMFFFPRLNGSDSRVQVFMIRDELKRKLLDIRGDNLGWTPIGKRYFLNFGCVEEGDKNMVKDVVLEFVLMGKWAQVWTHGSNVLF